MTSDTQDVPQQNEDAKEAEGYAPTEQEVKQSPRQQMMELLAGRRSEVIAAEAEGVVDTTHIERRDVGVPGETAGAESPVLDPLRAPTQVEQQLQTEPSAADPAAQQRMVRVKVNGQEHNVPEDELVRMYQKHQSADERLQRATELLREANERAAQLAAQLEQVGKGQQEPQPQSRGETPSDAVAAAKEVLSSLYEGDEDGAAEKLAKLLEGRATAPSREELVRAIVPLAVPAIQQEAAKSDALAALSRDYPMLFSDSDYSSIANAHAGRLLAQGKTEAEAILESANYVVSKFGLQKQGRPGGASPTGVDVDSARRLERKQAGDPVPGLNVGAGAPDIQEQSRSQTILEMRKARGQAA